MIVKKKTENRRKPIKRESSGADDIEVAQLPLVEDIVVRPPAQLLSLKDVTRYYNEKVSLDISRFPPPHSPPKLHLYLISH